MKSNSLNNRKRKVDVKLEAHYGYILVAPLMALIIVFTFFPAIYSFIISLFHYNPFGHLVYFVGLANYSSVVHSGLFAKALLDVLFYTVVVVTIQTVLAFMFAMLFNHRMMISRISRALVFIPAIVSSVALSIIFMWVFSDQGLINYFTSFFGIKPINFFFSTIYAFPAIMALNIFSTTPYFMIIYLAGLQTIPRSVLEAASLDGVKSGWHRFRYIYAPMLNFTTFIVVILGIIGSMQLFDQIYVITDGGPSHSTYVPLMFIYNRTFVYFGEVGLSAAASFILFFAILAITLLQRKYIKETRWS